MAAKRAHSPELVPNPFIKKRNLEWSIDLTKSALDVLNSDAGDEEHSPQSASASSSPNAQPPAAAAVEAGQAHVQDHLTYFSGILSKATISPFPAGMPHLSMKDYRKLYETNVGSPRGAHFVIHQHDHPIAGTHYDLRLQINETSSASWAIMYGLPADPNSQRLNRNATETRIHTLWNHLIETASTSTGSLLIWDTGTYQILARRSKHAPAEDPDSQNDSGADSNQLTEQEKLNRAFQARKIRLQLHGTRLPHNYVINLRLTKSEDAAGRAKSMRKLKTRRRRRRGGKAKASEPMTSSDSSDVDVGDEDEEDVQAHAKADQEGVSAMEREIRELEDEEVRRTNAYKGATNSIGSVHQRRWYLSLDREACGFVKHTRKGQVVWEMDENQQEAKADEEDGRLTFPFYVRGSEVERSVVTGRQGVDVFKDEGVSEFVQRKGWKPVLN